MPAEVRKLDRFTQGSSPRQVVEDCLTQVDRFDGLVIVAFERLPNRQGTRIVKYCSEMNIMELVGLLETAKSMWANEDA